MSGKIFENSDIIPKENPELIEQIAGKVYKIFSTCEDIHLVGSGTSQLFPEPKYSFIRDLDFVVGYSNLVQFYENNKFSWDVIQDQKANLNQIFYREIVKLGYANSQSGNRFSLLIPIEDKKFQVDLFLSDNVDWSREYFYDCPDSKYKSVHRNSLLYYFLKNFHDVYFQDNGLFQRFNNLKSGQLIYKELLINNWTQFQSEYLRDYTPINSFENIFRFITIVYKNQPHLLELTLQMTQKNLEKNGHEIPKELLDYEHAYSAS